MEDKINFEHALKLKWIKLSDSSSNDPNSYNLFLPKGSDGLEVLQELIDKLHSIPSSNHFDFLKYHLSDIEDQETFEKLIYDIKAAEDDYFIHNYIQSPSERWFYGQWNNEHEILRKRHESIVLAISRVENKIDLNRFNHTDALNTKHKLVLLLAIEEIFEFDIKSSFNEKKADGRPYFYILSLLFGRSLENIKNHLNNINKNSDFNPLDDRTKNSLIDVVNKSKHSKKLQFLLDKIDSMNTVEDRWPESAKSKVI